MAIAAKNSFLLEERVSAVRFRPVRFFDSHGWVILFFILVPFIEQSQSDTLQLHEVSVTPRLSDFSITQNIRSTDTLFLNASGGSNLGQLLQNSNAVFVKTYGASSIATTSIRGGNAAQTAVTWNGMNLRNPMLGETDLSILSVFMTDDVQLQYGGSTAMWGSGSVAGTIHLNNQVRFNEGTQVAVMLSPASYSNNTMALKAGYSDQKFSTSTRLLQSTGKNNFPVTDDDRNTFNLPHAEFFQYGILHEDHFKVRPNQMLSFRYWAQLTDRLIPPLINQQISTARQHDDFNRAMLEWQIRKEKLRVMIRNGFFYEKINYADSLIGLFSNSSSVTNSTEFELLYSISKINRIQAGINNTFCSGKSDGYLRAVHQNFTSLFAGYLLQSANNKHTVTINVREEYTRNKFQPITASLAFASKPLSFFELKGSVNKLYRLPTFNNLYWNPGGNPDLLPEEGFSEDLTANFSLKRKITESWSYNLQLQGTLFNRVVNNWIIWLPGANGIWTPRNLLRVWSRGAETNSSFIVTYKKITGRIFINSNYIVSTNQQKKNDNDESVGRQLIYTPVYSGAAGLQLMWKYFYFSFTQTYTGYRYLTADNYDYLEPYTLGNFIIGGSFRIKKCRADISFCLNNAFNENYTVMAQRPMPPANYLLNLKLFYQLTNKK